MSDGKIELTDDMVQPFMIDASGLHGRLVRMGPVVDTILSRHDYPEPLKMLLGKFLVLGAALATALKYEGVFTLQAKGDGIVPLIVADVTSAGDVRGYAQLTGDITDAEAAIAKPVSSLMGKGYIAFTVDQGPDTDRYQGIVELKGDTLEEAVDHYFEQSQQFNSTLTLAAEQQMDGSWRAGAIVLQRLPDEGGISTAEGDAEEDWTRATTLMRSASAAEMLSPDLGPQALLYRLFHEEGVRVFDPKPLDVGCRCSRERISGILKGMSQDDIDHSIVDDQISVNCEFCNQAFVFTAEEISQLRAG